MDRLGSADLLLFEGFRFDRPGGGLFRLDRDGIAEPVAIGSRAIGLLVERQGELVSKDAIMDVVWPGTAVEEGNLTVQISALRRVLDQDRTQGSCIQTVPGRGYRFVAAVRRVEPASPPVSARPAGNGSGGLSAADGRPHLPGAQGQLDDALPAPAPRARPRLWGIIFAMVFGALGLSAAVFTGLNWYSSRSGDLRPAPRLSIVVLPFANLNNDPDQQYFADAVTEDLTTAMSRISDSFVISRNTAFTYKDKPVNAKQIGRELSVRYVLEGSVRRAGNQVRISIQLIDAATDAHLWSELFDSDAVDLFALQNEITARIGNALGLELIGAEAARPTADPDALDYILRGRAARAKGPAGNTEAIGLFERALALDPRSVGAQGQLANALLSRMLEGMTDSAAADIARAEGLIDQVLAASPRNLLAHFAKGQALRAQRHCEEATLEYETVLAFDRNSAGALINIGRCRVYTGLLDEAIAPMEQAIRLSPHDPFIDSWYSWIGRVHLLQSRIHEAILWLEKQRSANPGSPFGHAWLASAYGIKGESERAAAELAEARRLSGDDRYSSISRLKAVGYFGVPKVRALFETTYLAGLRKAGMPERRGSGLGDIRSPQSRAMFAISATAKRALGARRGFQPGDEILLRIRCRWGKIGHEEDNHRMQQSRAEKRSAFRRLIRRFGITEQDVPQIGLSRTIFDGGMRCPPPSRGLKAFPHPAPNPAGSPACIFLAEAGGEQEPPEPPPSPGAVHFFWGRPVRRSNDQACWFAAIPAIATMGGPVRCSSLAVRRGWLAQSADPPPGRYCRGGGRCRSARRIALR